MIMNENEWNEWKLMKMYEIESFEFAAQVKTWQAEKLCVKTGKLYFTKSFRIKYHVVAGWVNTEETGTSVVI